MRSVRQTPFYTDNRFICLEIISLRQPTLSRTMPHTRRNLLLECAVFVSPTIVHSVSRSMFPKTSTTAPMCFSGWMVFVVCLNDLIKVRSGPFSVRTATISSIGKARVTQFASIASSQITLKLTRSIRLHRPYLTLRPFQTRHSVALLVHPTCRILRHHPSRLPP